MTATAFTQDELTVLLNLVGTVQGAAMARHLDEATLRRLSRVFESLDEFGGEMADSERVIQGLERIGPRIRVALGEPVPERDARPLR